MNDKMGKKKKLQHNFRNQYLSRHQTVNIHIHAHSYNAKWHLKCKQTYGIDKIDSTHSHKHIECIKYEAKD